MRLYPLKSRKDSFVSLEGDIEVEVVNQEKWSKLRVFTIHNSKTNSGCPQLTYSEFYMSILVDNMKDVVDLEHPQEIQLPVVKEYR